MINRGKLIEDDGMHDTVPWNKTVQDALEQSAKDQMGMVELSSRSTE